jgi:aspartate aminotransferase-like enzyme
MFGAQHRARSRRRVDAENDCAGARTPQRRAVFRIGEKGQVAWNSMLETLNALDLEPSIPFETAAQLLGKILEFHES